jgi:hypothetical protein
MISQKIKDSGIKEEKKGYFSIRNSMGFSGKLKKNRIEKMVVFKEIQKIFFSSLWLCLREGISKCVRPIL